MRQRDSEASLFAARALTWEELMEDPQSSIDDGGDLACGDALDVYRGKSDFEALLAADALL